MCNSHKMFSLYKYVLLYMEKKKIVIKFYKAIFST